MAGEPQVEIGRTILMPVHIEGAPERSPRRLVSVRGDWHLWIYCCDWSLTLNGIQQRVGHRDDVAGPLDLGEDTGVPLTDLGPARMAGWQQRERLTHQARRCFRQRRHAFRRRVSQHGHRSLVGDAGRLEHVRRRLERTAARREQVLGALAVQRHPHGARDARVDRLADQVVPDENFGPGADEEISGDALGDPGAQVPG